MVNFCDCTPRALQTNFLNRKQQGYLRSECYRLTDKAESIQEMDIPTR